MTLVQAMSGNRKLHYLRDISELRSGDVLLFRMPKQKKTDHKRIAFFQSLIHQQDGHYDTTHSAICIGKQGGKPWIANVDINGYFQESLDEMLKRDGGDRAFLVYRPLEKRIGKAIALEASNPEFKKSMMKWSYWVAIKSFFKNPTHKLKSDQDKHKIKTVGLSSICSKFVVQVIKAATGQKNPDYYPNIKSTITPKALEAYLYHDRSYEYLCFPGENPYHTLQKEMEKEVTLLGRMSHANTQFRVLKGILDDQDQDDLQKALTLLREMLTVLPASSLKIFSSPKTRILNAARKMGIFERDVGLLLTK